MRDGWREVRLGDVADTQLGKTLPRGEGRTIGGMPYLRNVNVQWGSISTENLNTMEFSGAERQQLSLRKGDVLVCEGGEVGRCALVEDDMPGVFFQNAIHRLRTKGSIMPAFLAYSVENIVKNGGLEGITSRVTIAHLNQSKLRSLELSLPPLDEQRRIVDLIGAVDDTVEIAVDRALATRSLFSATLDTMVGGVPDDPPVTLAEQFRVIDCEHKTAPRSQRAFAYSVGTSDIRGGRFILEAAKPVSENTYREWTARAEPIPDDVILTREAPVGQVALVGSDTGRICLGQRTVLIRPTGSVPGAYLWASLLSRSYQTFLESRSIGQTVRRVNVKLIKELPIRIPSPSEALKVTELAMAFMDVINAEDSRIHALRKLRSELLSALLSGAHRIPETYDELMGADSMKMVGA